MTWSAIAACSTKTGCAGEGEEGGGEEERGDTGGGKKEAAEHGELKRGLVSAERACLGKHAAFIRGRNAKVVRHVSRYCKEYAIAARECVWIR